MESNSIAWGRQIRKPCSPSVVTHPPAPFGSRILTSMPHKGWLLAPFWGSFWVRWHSKSSSFLAFKKAKSLVCNRWVGRFVKIVSFFPFPRFSPLPVPFQVPMPQALDGSPATNQSRLPRIGAGVKGKTFSGLRIR